MIVPAKFSQDVQHVLVERSVKFIIVKLIGIVNFNTKQIAFQVIGNNIIVNTTSSLSTAINDFNRTIKGLENES